MNDFYFIYVLIHRDVQESDNLETLLTVDGLKYLKMLSIRNLDYRADDKGELELMNNFMQKAKDVSMFQLGRFLKKIFEYQ